MKFPYKRLLQTITAVILLTSCGGSIVKEVDYAPTPDIPETAHPTPIKYSGIELLLPPGMNIGEARHGIFCNSPAYPVNRNVIAKEIDHKFLRQGFHDAMEANGYDVVGSLDIAFDPDDEEQRAEYSIAGKLKDAQLDMCTSQEGALNWATPVPGEHGRMYIAIDWSVYDVLHRTVVYKTRTEGYTSRSVPNTEGLTLLFQDAFEMAVHNLAANEPFRALVVDGVKPPQKWPGKDMRGEKTDTRERLFDEDEDVTLPSQKLSRQPFAKTAQNGGKVAVLIEKGGHGSGFFITKQGHILTNAHVVGESRRTRIVTAARKTGITAEVLRVDRVRDVALLKLEEIPEWLEITTLPIRLDWPGVGEDIYAIGSPKDWKAFKGTISKGIVSAHRRNLKYGGPRSNYIQGDIETHPGSSGGPLLDEYGNIVGLSVKGEPFANENGSRIGIGLNLFIPIREALDRLGIAYEGQ
ncbi:MAG: trypsin-like peptidase domain-containing protein [Alphaproteobacteria bacterium]|nr:trypsin-like peptidase domain-containing protein [Alphaproteobacteria bacterium]